MPREPGDGSSASLSLGGAAALAALFYDPAAGAADSKRVLVLFTAVVALAITLAKSAKKRGLRRIDVAPACALWLAFVAFSALSLAWGVPSGAAKLGTWVGAAGLLVASMALPRAEAERAALMAGASIGGVSAAIAVAQFALGARGLAIHGGHGNPNWLGLILSISLPLSVDLALDLRGLGRRSWFLAAAAALATLPALWLSHSRVAWAATAVSLVGWAIVARALRGGQAIIAGALACSLVVRGAYAHADPTDLTPDGSAPGSVDAPLVTAWDGRVWIWTASVDAAKRALPLGEGLGGFAAAYLDAQGARLSTLEPKVASRRFVNATTAHSDWIEAAVEAGLPGFALLVAAVGSGIVSFLRRARAQRREEEPDAPEIRRWPAGAAALLAFMVCASGDSPMHQPGAVVLVALVLGASPRTTRVGARRFALATAAIGLVLAGSAALLAMSLGGWLCARRITRANEALLDERIGLLASAARVDPRSGEAALALGLARLSIGDARRALDDLAHSRALLANIGTDVAIGNALSVEGEAERAVAAYKRAIARHPGYFRARANVAEALVSLGRLDEAEAQLLVAQSLWPGHPKLAGIAERLRKARIEAATQGL